ncbi:hypothetical protein L1049_006186 [Liquidambar formosana]|uniref:Uncharacterized protein n=1 Tax=Liquidambar formosana TaxID=63359 RepID=A0AAP0RGT9_LIQFO
MTVGCRRRTEVSRESRRDGMVRVGLKLDDGEKCCLGPASFTGSLEIDAFNGGWVGEFESLSRDEEVEEESSPTVMR